MDYSQTATWEFPLSRMPSLNTYKRQRRTGSYSSSAQSAKKKQMIVSVPRAIRTRGTPDGYYEIPCTQLIRVRCTTSTGFWNTNQSTLAGVGGTGYKGMALLFKYDGITVNLGVDNTVIDSFGSSTPDIASLQAVFDEVKIAKIRVECWTNVATGTLANSSAFSAEIWSSVDQNDAFPPGLNIQEYSKSKRFLPDRVNSVTFTPNMVLNTTSDNGSGASDTAGVVTNGYFKLGQSNSLYGIKFFNWLPYEPDGADVYYFHMKITQTRRYRRQR